MMIGGGPMLVSLVDDDAHAAINVALPPHLLLLSSEVLREEG
jgi:hypothetical protein